MELKRVTYLIHIRFYNKRETKCLTKCLTRDESCYYSINIIVHLIFKCYFHYCVKHFIHFILVFEWEVNTPRLQVEKDALLVYPRRRVKKIVKFLNEENEYLLNCDCSFCLLLSSSYSNSFLILWIFYGETFRLNWSFHHFLHFSSDFEF